MLTTTHRQHCPEALGHSGLKLVQVTQGQLLLLQLAASERESPRSKNEEGGPLELMLASLKIGLSHNAWYATRHTQAPFEDWRESCRDQRLCGRAMVSIDKYVRNAHR